MDVMLTEGMLGYVLLSLLALGGALLYLGIGTAVTGALGPLEKKIAGDRNKELWGHILDDIPRRPTWLTTLGWPPIAFVVLFRATIISAAIAVIVLVVAMAVLVLFVIMLPIMAVILVLWCIAMIILGVCVAFKKFAPILRPTRLIAA